MDLERSELTRYLVETALDKLVLSSKRSHSLVAVFLNFVHTHNLAPICLRFFKQYLVHFLSIFALHSILRPEGAAFFKTEL